eukprot:EG_transcript_3308
MALSNKRALLAVAVVGAVVVVGGVTYYGFRHRRARDEEEDLTFDTPAGGKAAGSAGEGRDGGAKGDYKHFLEYGVSLQLPADWDALVDDYSMAPQIAVIRIHPPGYEHAMLGELPSLSVIVEDVGREQMTLLAYKEKSKEFAMSMAGGHAGLSLMTAPEITKDSSVTVGQFQHTLEYVQMFPNVQTGGHSPFKFMNLMTLHKGLAYVLQYMARSDRFPDHFDTANAIAEKLIIRDLPARPASRVEFCSQPHSLKVTVPETWSWVRENKDMGDGRTLVVSFVSGSSSKPDSISIYTLGKAAASSKAMAERYREAIKASGEVVGTEGDVAHLSYNADGKIVVAYCRRDYVLECRPEGQRVTHHSQEDAVVCGVLRGIKPCKGLPRSHCRYFNAQHRVSFELNATSRLQEHKWGSTCVTYIPVTEEEEQGLPVLSLEVNVEEEVYPDLQAVEAKIMAGTDPNTPLKEKRIETYGGRDFLTFQLSRDEQLSPWGQPEEYKSKILLTLRGKESVMAKWEVAAREWQRHERHLTAVMQSLEIAA